MDPFESLVIPMDLFSKKMHLNARHIVRFIEVNKHFWSLETINYLITCINY